MPFCCARDLIDIGCASLLGQVRIREGLTKPYAVHDDAARDGLRRDDPADARKSSEKIRKQVRSTCECCERQSYGKND